MPLFFYEIEIDKIGKMTIVGQKQTKGDNMLMSTREASIKANVSTQTIYSWLKKGLKHSSIYVGTRRFIRIKEEDLNAYIREKRGK